MTTPIAEHLPHRAGDPAPEPHPEGGPALVVGEALIDVVRRPGCEDQEHAGGSAANVAIALARLGRPVRLATSWGPDDRGAVLAQHLARDGVTLAGDPEILPRTSTAVATLAPSGAASYDFDLDWRLPPIAAGGPRVVHACSIAAVLPPGCDDVHALAERLRLLATLTYDLNARPGITGTGADVVARVEALAALADVVKASDEDLEMLWPDRPEPETVAALLEAGPAAVVVTRGGTGVAVTTREGTAAVRAPGVEVADTIGAGDTLGAALIDALWGANLLGGERREALRTQPLDGWRPLLEHACRAAAVTVSRPGADPPYRAELA